jgi:WG containing repeat
MKKLLLAVGVLCVNVSVFAEGTQVPKNSINKVKDIVNSEIQESGPTKGNIITTKKFIVPPAIANPISSSVTGKSSELNSNRDGYSPIKKSYDSFVKEVKQDPTREKSDPTKNANATTCLNNRSGEALVASRDLEGKDILAFPLNKLKSNVRYGFVENYKQGFARIKKDQVWGFLNLCGDEVITCQYDEAEAFNQGKALVKRLVWYFIDDKGVESDVLNGVVEAKPMIGGLSLVKFKDDKMALIDNSFDKTGKPVTEYFDSMIALNTTTLGVKANGKWGIYKIGNNSPIITNYDQLEPSGKDNLFKVRVANRIGLINANGDILIKPDYNIITDADRYGYVKGINETSQQLINTNDFKISKVYQNISNFDARGLALVQDINGLYGLVDKDLSSVLEPIYATIGNINDFDLIPVSKEVTGKGIKFGLINTKGQEIIPFEYDGFGKVSKKGLMVAKETMTYNIDLKGKIGTCKADKVIDINGSVVVPAMLKPNDAGKVNYIVTDSVINNNIVIKAYRSDEKHKFLKYMLVRNEDFKLITPEPFEYIQLVRKGQFYFVKQNGLWGTLDTTGKYLVKCQFKSILFESEEYYQVEHDNGKFGYIDSRGKNQILAEYESLDYYRNGLSIASKGNNQVGLINKFNAKVIPCVFKEVKYSEIAKEFEVTDNQGNRFKLNQQGECFQNCGNFESIRAFENLKENTATVGPSRKK